MGNGECPFYESIRTVLKLPVSDRERQTQLEQMGVENTLLNAIHLELGEKAAAGDVQAAKYLRDTAMTKPCGQTTAETEGLDFSALTDDELRMIAAQGAEKR